MFEVQKKYTYILMLDGFSNDFLSNPEKQADLKAVALELSYNREYGTAQDIYMRLKKDQGDGNIKGIKEVLKHFQAACLPLLEPGVVIQFIKTNAVWALRNHYEITEQIVDHLLFYMDYVTLGETQDELILKIKNNQEKIGEGVDLGNDKFNPTVQRWLSEFDNLYPLDKKRGRLEEMSFINQNQVVRRLPEEDKIVLQELLELYNVILFGRRDIYVTESEDKFKSKKEEKEEVVEKPVAVTQDINKPADGIIPPSPLTDKLLKNYKINVLDWKLVAKGAQELLKLADNVKDFQNKFHKAINSRDSQKIVSYLLALAHQGELDEIFERDQKIKEIFSKHLVEKFNDKLGEHFNKNLTLPVYLSYFLQHVFKDILKFEDNESAVIAIKLTNELKRAGDKEYLPIAYGDITAGIFKWKTIIEKNDQLDLLEK